MNRYDDAHDIRAALGGLLVDEPAAPWSVQDDVARGRSLQRRRRTTALGGIGLAAALALVVGLLGPWSPTATAPPADQPPAVEGVDQEWLRSLSNAFYENRMVSVDWSESSVVAEDGGGFSLDLALVPTIVRVGPSQLAEADPSSPAPPVTRALVHWSPVSGVGPVLASCRTPECDPLPDGDFPGFVETGGRWIATGVQPEGTNVVDRTYDAGGTLEIAAVPLVPADESSSGGEISQAFLRLVQDAVGRPGDAAVVAADLATAVSDALERLGWITVAVAGPDTEPGSPEVKTWNVGRADSGGAVTAKLVVRTWDATSFAEGPVPRGGALDTCQEADACGMVDVITSDCSSGPCWSRMDATIQKQYDVLPVGTAIVTTWSLSPRAGVEIAATPPATAGGAPDPMQTAAFLTQDERSQLLGIIQTWLLAQPAPEPEPETPTTIAACGRGEVKLIPAVGQPSEATGARGLWIEIHARNPEVDCLATKPESVTFADAAGGDLGMRTAEGVYQGQDFDAAGIEVRQESGPVRFALTKYRCDGAPAIRVATVYVTLEGWDRPVAVELPESAGMERCPGGDGADGNTVYVSALDG